MLGRSSGAIRFPNYRRFLVNFACWYPCVDSRAIPTSAKARPRQSVTFLLTWFVDLSSRQTFSRNRHVSICSYVAALLSVPCPKATMAEIAAHVPVSHQGYSERMISTTTTRAASSASPASIPLPRAWTMTTSPSTSWTSTSATPPAWGTQSASRKTCVSSMPFRQLLFAILFLSAFCPYLSRSFLRALRT